MTKRFIVVAFTVLAVMAATRARADQRSERAVIADRLNQLATSATNLATAASGSDDRGARKKFAPKASELAVDLAALAKRLGKEVTIKALATEAAAIDKDAGALIELADEANDREERKSLRAQAVLVEQGVAQVRKSIEAVKDDGAKDSGAQRYTGRVFNTSNGDKCSFAENMKFVISRDGQQVYASQNMVFPGQDFALVLDKGRYLVQLLDTSGKLLAQGTLDAGREGWAFRSGCVNQD